MKALYEDQLEVVVCMDTAAVDKVKNIPMLSAGLDTFMYGMGMDIDPLVAIPEIDVTIRLGEGCMVLAIVVVPINRDGAYRIIRLV